MRHTIISLSLSLLSVPAFGALSVGDFAILTTDDSQITASTVNGSVAAGNVGNSGDALLMSNSTVNGDVVVGGPFADNGGNSITGSTSSLPGPAFAALDADLAALSADLTAKPANGTYTSLGINLNLNGTDPVENVFNVNVADLTTPLASGTLTFNVPTTSNVLVNVVGTSTLLNKTFTTSFVNAQASNILFHFPDSVTGIDNINIQGSFPGSIFAPSSNIAFQGSTVFGDTISGSIVAQEIQLNANLVNDISTHGYFDGVLVIPEPAQVIGSITAGLAILLLLRRRVI